MNYEPKDNSALGTKLFNQLYISMVLINPHRLIQTGVTVYNGYKDSEVAFTCQKSKEQKLKSM